MLALSGARQISGNNVRMSIRIAECGRYSTISSVARCPWRAAELASKARMAWIVWPLRPMTRPTSVWRSYTRKIVVFPEGISESIISSGNSTSWRMTNSRNSFTAQSLFEL